jgi:hypothetical protein
VLPALQEDPANGIETTAVVPVVVPIVVTVVVPITMTITIMAAVVVPARRDLEFRINQFNFHNIPSF